MCRKLDESKSFAAKAFFRKDNLPDGAAYWFTGTAIPCECGAKTFFKPDTIDNIVEVTPCEK
jgi:hypothetical protein